MSRYSVSSAGLGYVPGSALDPRVCDQGAGEIIRLLQYAPQLVRPHYQQVAASIADQYARLETRRQAGEAVCIQIASLGRQANEALRLMLANP